LKRVLTALASCHIDSYYLIIMKIEHNGTEYIPHVYLVDMLDFLDYTVFNSGPGQMMLKEAHFYPAVDSLYAAGKYYPVPRLTLSEKVDKLYAMLEAADTQLFIDREKKRLSIEKQVAKYHLLPSPTISKTSQKAQFDLG
jgi:hypothetical protein